MSKMQVRQLPMGSEEPVLEGQQRFEQVFHQNFRHCDCEMPMITKKWNEAMGTFVALRLCCLAKAVEKLTGERLYEVYHFAPRWVWDCDAIEPKERPDGTIEMRQKGPPPKWMLKRMRERGIAVRNLPRESR